MTMYSMIEVNNVQNTSLKEHKKKIGLNGLPVKMTVAQ